MFKNKLFVLMLLITIVFSISAVSAIDADNATLETNIYDLTDLADKVNATDDGETLCLESDYETTDSSNQIVISKSITIDGQNHVIEAPDVKRVFLIEADNVCIKNINFINSRTTGLAGGVISWLGDNGTLENCSFTNNSASSAGGAVCWIGDFGKITNCLFENNDVAYGPAVSLTCRESFDPHAIHIQVVNSEGGALYIGGNDVSVDLCRFYSNAALLNGGAISVNGANVSISSSKLRNNTAVYNGGAIDLNGDNAYLSNLKFFENSPNDLFLNSNNATIVDSGFKDNSSIDSWYEVRYENVSFGIGNFNDLSDEINLTPEGGILVLDRDYEYTTGSIKGILISKSIIIDGAGHTLNGKKLSRIFNITAGNVTIKNVNFINGDALGSYAIHYGGGAIYWNGTDGYVENCNFTNNGLYTFEYDPYEKDEIIVDENGMSYVIYMQRPDGATTSQGGAITWIGDNGKIVNSTFRHNAVGYANDGGAVFWAGSNGKIINSQFYENDAFRGSAIYWNGVNGTISLSTLINSGICDNGIFWTGKNGAVRNSILLSSYGDGKVISPYSVDVKADFNYWGDTLDNQNMVNKSSNVNYWVLMDFTPDRDFVFENESFMVSYDFKNAVDRSGNIYVYEGMDAKSGRLNFTSNKTGLLNMSFDGEFKFDVISYNSSGDFYDLLIRIHETPEGGILVLDRDYEFISGFNKGILISKSITIDGAGHTLNGHKLSRMFNITASKVTIMNTKFINGNALGGYFTRTVGGGAIYWSGDDGFLLNCSFDDNSGSGIEYDPFDKMGISVDDEGRIWYHMRMRMMGVKLNEGGAIVWNGTNGTVSGCVFIGNSVGYPNTGGAICWKGDDGKVVDSKFMENDAWCGSAIAWIGDNGEILSSIFVHASMFDGGIYWFGHNGTIKNSILLGSSYRSALRPVDCDVNADFNFWGDVIDSPNSMKKIKGISNWMVMNITHNGELVKKGQTVTLHYQITNLMDKKGNIINYTDFTDELSGDVNYTASKTGYLKASWVNNKISVKIDSKDKITGKNLVKYYSKKTSFKVKVTDVSGKVVAKKVKFTINGKNYYPKTDKNGVATLKLKLKPGKYAVQVSYGDAKAKYKITIKKTLITKNVSKKVKKSGKFTVKVLNSKGKAFSKQTVKIKFKGKTYKIKTDKKGIATFKIPKNLKVGKYTIKTTYNGLSLSNKIVVKK